MFWGRTEQFTATAMSGDEVPIMVVGVDALVTAYTGGDERVFRKHPVVPLRAAIEITFHQPSLSLHLDSCSGVIAR